MISFDEAPPLIDPSELSSLPGAPFADDVVAAAADLVRRACGWHIAPTWERTIPVGHQGGRTLMLPTLHLVEIVSLTDVRTGDGLTGWEADWSDSGLVEREQPWPRGLRAVEAVVRDGLPQAPPDLKAVVAAVASDLRSLLATTATGARVADLQMVQLDGGSVTYKTAASVYSDTGGMLSHTRALARYRL